MKMVLKLSLAVALFAPLILVGQPSPIPVNISVFNESTAIPFTRFVATPVHPGLQIGTEFNYRQREHTRFFQTANASYFYHNYLAQGIGLNTELGYEYRFRSGIAAEALLGLGYIHTFATTEEFDFRDGKYVKKGDKGNARFYPSLSLDAGYYIKKSEKYSPKIFLRYQSWAEYPYSPDFIPVMTHINLHIGIKLFIKPNSGKNE